MLWEVTQMGRWKRSPMIFSKKIMLEVRQRQTGTVNPTQMLRPVIPMRGMLRHHHTSRPHVMWLLWLGALAACACVCVCVCV